MGPWNRQREEQHFRVGNRADSAPTSVGLRVTRTKNPLQQSCSTPLTEGQRWERCGLPTGWTATDSDPATAGLEVSITQETANKTASDSPLSHDKLRNDRTISFFRPTVHKPSTTPMGDMVRIGLHLGMSQFFCRHYSYHKSR